MTAAVEGGAAGIRLRKGSNGLPALLLQHGEARMLSRKDSSATSDHLRLCEVT